MRVVAVVVLAALMLAPMGAAGGPPNGVCTFFETANGLHGCGVPPEPPCGPSVWSEAPVLGGAGNLTMERQCGPATGYDMPRKVWPAAAGSLDLLLEAKSANGEWTVLHQETCSTDVVPLLGSQVTCNVTTHQPLQQANNFRISIHYNWGPCAAECTWEATVWLQQ